MAAQALHDLVAPGPSGRGVTPAAILTAVSRFYSVGLDELKGRARHKRIVLPRQIAMYLLREDAHLSTPEVGRLLNRDHTTVLHGLKQVANDIARDGACRAAVRGVREVVAGGGVQLDFRPRDGVLGKGLCESEIILRCGWTEDGLGELAVAVVAASVDLSVEAAAAGLWIVRRGHVLCIAAAILALKGLRVPQCLDGSP
jgi:hypothetical protein